jgi:methionine salvage enolase-phosphatase E1
MKESLHLSGDATPTCPDKERQGVDCYEMASGSVKAKQSVKRS